MDLLLERLITRWSNRFALIGNKERTREVCEETGDWTDAEDLKDWNEWQEYEAAKNQFTAAVKSYAAKAADKARIEELKWVLNDVERDDNLGLLITSGQIRDRLEKLEGGSGDASD